MANINIGRNSVRIPNLPLGQIVDAEGKATGDELTFRQSLLTLLAQLIGEEGMVIPSQTAANITTIQNNVQTFPGATPDTAYTCQPGTLIYDSTNDLFKVAILVAGVPTFMTVTVT